MTEPPRKPWAPGFVSVCILSFFLFSCVIFFMFTIVLGSWS